MDLDQQALEAQNRQSEVMMTDAGVEFVRTPNTCFENLPDWPYEPQYVEIDGLRQAYVDVGPADAEETILLLPTSSVDADTERRLQRALGEVRAGRTTFVIAHRLWTVQQSDQILVLRDGRIVERARSTPDRSAHEALLAAGGFYRQVYALQFQAETLAGEPGEGGAR